MGLFNSNVKTVKMDYMGLANIFDKVLLVPEYASMQDDLLKKLKKIYFGSVTDTPDGKYKFYISAANVYLFPFVRRYIWIRDNANNVVYELDSAFNQKKFRNAAINAIANKKLRIQ